MRVAGAFHSVVRLGKLFPSSKPQKPMQQSNKPPLPATPVDLGDGLRLRFAAPEDFDALVDYIKRVPEYDSPVDSVVEWAHELMSGRHPTTRAGDFTVVEDTRTGKIVSSLCLIPQTWSYGGIPFGCGRIEHVATDPAYRRRGLVRAQMDLIHGLSASKGDLMQSITGIPWYYRQFGYAYAMDLYCGRRVRAPMPEPQHTPRYRVRPLRNSDHGFVRSVYEHAAQRQPFSVVRSDAHWEWEFSGRSPTSEVYRPWLIIEDMAQTPVGYLQHHPLAVKPDPWRLEVRQCALAAGVSHLNVVPELPPALALYVKALRAAEGVAESAQPGEIAFTLGRENPVYAGLSDALKSHSWGYAWYIRIPNLAAFLRHVRPALESHLRGTPAEGYTGTLTLDFFRGGLRLAFEEGRIVDVATLSHSEVDPSDAAFPDLTFLELLGGRRTYAQIKESDPDCRASDRAQALLAALFPPFTGNLWHSD